MICVEQNVQNIVGENEIMGEYTSRSEKGRTVLADVVPVRTPFVVGLWLGDICNFKCKYCVQSTSNTTDLYKYFMDWDTFKVAADNLAIFPDKIKKILFQGTGEPLLNKNLPQMIKYLKERDVADTYEAVTNASMLTHDLSRKLIDAGLNRLCVSIQGVTDEKYWEICQAKVNLAKIVDELRYFYSYANENGKKCRVHIKTVNIALEPGEEKIFREIFSSCSDTLYVDTVVPVYQAVDYSNMCDGDTGMFGDKMGARVVCPPVFYTCYIMPNGDVVPCCAPPQPMKYGSICDNTLVDIWNSPRRMNFLKMQLKGKRYDNKVCAKCAFLNTSTYEEDNLDEAPEEILQRLELK